MTITTTIIISIIVWSIRFILKVCLNYLKNLGPPESMREHVVAASKQMRKGNWRECAEFILAVKVYIYIYI
jgi:hypothetical protein